MHFNLFQLIFMWHKKCEVSKRTATKNCGKLYANRDGS